MEESLTSVSRKKNYGFWVEVGIQVLIVLSVLAISFETLPGLTNAQKQFLHSFEIFCVSVFTIEYFTRIYLAKKKLKFIFSFYGIIDLFAILPFYLSFGVDLKTLRLFRLFRLVRLLKLIRYNKALRHFKKAVKESKEEIILYLLMTSIFLYICATVVYHFENGAQPDKFTSIFDSLWWAVCTITTVGYGDVYPITIGGKIFTIFILIVGLGIVTVPAGILASKLLKTDE